MNTSKAPAILRRAGLRVTTGVLEEECRRLNRDFFTWAVLRRPYTTLKLALSLDGRIADRRGRSKWISSPPSRRYVHYLRSRSDAVMIGLKTLVADDPELTVRMGYRHPDLKKVVLDSTASLPLTSRLLRGNGASKTILATTSAASARRLREISSRGAQVLKVPSRAGRVSLKSLFRKLAGQGIMRLLVEGGGETAAAVLEEGLVDEVHFFLAPIIIGDREAVPAVGGSGVANLKEAWRLNDMAVERLGPDIHISGLIKKRT